jgi:hypothetical protein
MKMAHRRERESSLQVTKTTYSGLQEHRIIVYTATGQKANRTLDMYTWHVVYLDTWHFIRWIRSATVVSNILDWDFSASIRLNSIAFDSQALERHDTPPWHGLRVYRTHNV